MRNESGTRPFQRLIDVGFGMSEGNKPEAAFDGADPLLQQAATQMAPASRIVPPDIISVIGRGPLGGAWLQHHGMENQSWSLGDEAEVQTHPPTS